MTSPTFTFLTAPASLTLGALAALALTQAAAAQAAPVHTGYSHDSTQVVRYTTIAFQDLDLRSEAGLRTLLARIDASADRVCGGRASAGRNSTGPSYEECVRDAVGSAVAYMRLPALTELAAHGTADKVAAR